MFFPSAGRLSGSSVPFDERHREEGDNWITEIPAASTEGLHCDGFRPAGGCWRRAAVQLSAVNPSPCPSKAVD